MSFMLLTIYYTLIVGMVISGSMFEAFYVLYSHWMVSILGWAILDIVILLSLCYPYHINNNLNGVRLRLIYIQWQWTSKHSRNQFIIISIRGFFSVFVFVLFFFFIIRSLSLLYSWPDYGVTYICPVVHSLCNRFNGFLWINVFCLWHTQR